MHFQSTLLLFSVLGTQDKRCASSSVQLVEVDDFVAADKRVDGPILVLDPVIDHVGIVHVDSHDLTVRNVCVSGSIVDVLWSQLQVWLRLTTNAIAWQVCRGIEHRGGGDQTVELCSKGENTLLKMRQDGADSRCVLRLTCERLVEQLWRNIRLWWWHIREIGILGQGLKGFRPAKAVLLSPQDVFVWYLADRADLLHAVDVQVVLLVNAGTSTLRTTADEDFEWAIANGALPGNAFLEGKEVLQARQS